jgi:hypothetical protein
MLSVILIGLLALILGLTFCFGGYRFFIVLMPIFGFFAGFGLGADVINTLFGAGFLATLVSWAAGLVVGLLFAGLSYAFYNAAVMLLGGLVGYWLGASLMILLGFAPGGFLVFTVGLVVGIIFSLATLILGMPKYLLIFLTAFGGASTVISGVLLLLGRVPLEALNNGAVAAIVRGSFLWLFVWLAVGLIGFVVQWNNNRVYTLNPPPARF